jgi:hypothetical protein
MRRSRLLLAVLILASVMNAEAQPCTPSQLIPVGPGPEDFDLQRNGPRGPRLIISLKDRRRPGAPGKLVMMDLEGEQRERPSDAKIEGREGKPPLHPVGISLVEQPNETLLYVIHSNIPADQTWVERYRVVADTLVYADPVLSDPLIRTPNDLVALPGGELYLSNSGFGRRKLADVFGSLFSIARGSVLHYDGANWKPLLPKALFPNGLAVDPEGRYVFLNLFSAKRMRIYDRGTKAFLPHDVKFKGYPDNLLWEVPGETLNVAAHRSQLRTGLHTLSRRFQSPSVGFRVDVRAAIAGAGERAVTQLYDLLKFDASSTALAYGGRIYVSQLVDPHIAVVNCPR